MTKRGKIVYNFWKKLEEKWAKENKINPNKSREELSDDFVVWLMKTYTKKSFKEELEKNL